MKLLKKLLNVYLETLSELFNHQEKKTDTRLLPKSVKDRIEFIRDSSNELETVNPKYKGNDYSILTQYEIRLAQTKLRLNPINVSDNEKRLFTLRAAFYERYIPEELVLIDGQTLRYYNYLNSTINLEYVDKKLIDKERVSKNIEYNDGFMEYFISIIFLYESLLDQGKVLPFDFFLHRFLKDNYALDRLSLEQYQRNSFIARQYMTAYAYIFDKPIPEDYIIINEDTKTFIYAIDNLLNNRKHEPLDPSKTKQVKLTIVK